LKVRAVSVYGRSVPRIDPDAMVIIGPAGAVGDHGGDFSGEEDWR